MSETMTLEMKRDVLARKRMRRLISTHRVALATLAKALHGDAVSTCSSELAAAARLVRDADDKLARVEAGLQGWAVEGR